MEVTIKIINTPDHSLFPMGKSYNFTINPTNKIQDLYKLMDDKIKETYKVPTFLTFTLLTNKKGKLSLENIINTTFTTHHRLDIIDLNENIFHLYFHTRKEIPTETYLNE